MATPRFGRVITAMVTPFDGSGRINFDEATRLGRYLLTKGGSDGLVIAGTTGESPTLSRDEELALFKRLAWDLRGLGSMIFNIGTNWTADDVEFIKRVHMTEGLVPDAFMAVAPYYNCPPQEGLYEHFAALAQAADPYALILYNVPGRTVTNIAPETVVQLANDFKNIVAIKEASGNPEQVRQIVEGAPEGFEVISGDDAKTQPLVSGYGVTGVISVASHLIGNEMAGIIRKAVIGDIQGPEGAFALNEHYRPLYDALFMSGTKSPMMVKAALEMLGWKVGRCRQPLPIARPEHVQALRETMNLYELLPK